MESSNELLDIVSRFIYIITFLFLFGIYHLWKNRKLKETMGKWYTSFKSVKKPKGKGYPVDKKNLNSLAIVLNGSRSFFKQDADTCEGVLRFILSSAVIYMRKGLIFRILPIWLNWRDDYFKITKTEDGLKLKLFFQDRTLSWEIDKDDKLGDTLYLILIKVCSEFELDYWISEKIEVPPPQTEEAPEQAQS